MALTSFRLWSTTVAVFVLCWVLLSAYRLDPCSKYTPYRIIALCVWRNRNKRDLPQPEELFTNSNLFPRKDRDPSANDNTMLYRTRRSNNMHHVTDEYVPVVKRRWSAVRMLADSCCRSNCDIFKICA